MLSQLAQRIKNGVNKQQSLFDSVVGQIKTQEKRWIVDIDSLDYTYSYVKNVGLFINSLKPEGEKIETVIPTKNGCHFITQKFDVNEFKKVYPHFEIQKKNPTLLYYPNSLD
jgi:hypothetical protein